MPQFIITISEPSPNSDTPVEYYYRRVDTDDLNLIIQRLDQALNVKVRRRRADAGKARTSGDGLPTLG